MYPNLIKIGDFTITSFGLMLFLSFVTAAWVLSRELRRRGLRGELAWDVLAWVALGGIVGARLYYLALHVPDLLADPIGELTSRGGLVWFGGFIGGAVAYFWQVQRRKLPLLIMFDAVAPGLALAYAVGRVGCFLVGDDYGLPTDSWVGIAFPEGLPPSTAGYLRSAGADIPASVPDSAIMKVHPTQLYEVAAGLLMFVVLSKFGRRQLRPGQLWGLFLILYGVERFLIEFVRAKTDHVLYGLTTSQIASVLVFVLGVYLMARRATAAEGAADPKPNAAAGAR